MPIILSVFESVGHNEKRSPVLRDFLLSLTRVPAIVVSLILGHS